MVAEVPPIVVQTALSILVALIVAVVSYHFALRAFYRQRWWETRRDGYLELFEALHNHYRDAEVRWLKETSGHAYDAVFLASLAEKASSARAIIHRYAALAD